MNANKPTSRRALKANLVRVDAHVVKLEEYDELPELTSDMRARDSHQRWTARVSKSPQVDLAALAVRSDRAMQSHRPWLVNPHGRTA